MLAGLIVSRRVLSVPLTARQQNCNWVFIAGDVKNDVADQIAKIAD